MTGGSNGRRKFRPTIENLEGRLTPANNFYVVPGAANVTTRLQFDFSGRSGGGNDEFGIYVLDNAKGDVGGVPLTSFKYPDAVFHSAGRQVIFETSAAPGAHRTI